MSLTLEPRQICEFVGPNGSGKTTALRAIAGARRPDGGYVRLDGREPFTDPACRARIGFLSDRISVYPPLTPREYLQHFARAYEIDPSTAADRIDHALDRTDLTRLAPGDCSTLSRGMHQRLALARLLVQRPDLLLLDEPAVGLDPLGRKLLWDLLREMADARRMILINSHVLNDCRPPTQQNSRHIVPATGDAAPVAPRLLSVD